MEPVKEYTNVTFDEIQIGATAEIDRHPDAKPDRSGCHGLRGRGRLLSDAAGRRG